MSTKGATSLIGYLRQLEEATEPQLAFKARSLEEWALWRDRLRTRLVELLFLPKERVDLESEIVEAKDCESYIREKIFLKTEANFILPAYLLKPKISGEKPAVLALHGHGRGKIDVVGIYDDEVEYQRFIAPLNYDYGLQLVRRGYIVLAPDGRAFGELASDGMNCTWLLTASMLFGRTVVGMRVWDAMRSLDYLETLPDVDPERIGCLGLSWGGTWTVYTSALDERIKAAIVSGYFSSFRDMLIERSCCPCQYVPGIRFYADFPDIVPS
ncbi:MAG: alpha/beta hydrolase family protein [Candidatus Bathyarchaeia archaeon]